MRGDLVPCVDDDSVDERDEECEEDETVRVGLGGSGREFGGGNFPRFRNREAVVLEDLSGGETSSGENDGNTESAEQDGSVRCTRVRKRTRETHPVPG